MLTHRRLGPSDLFVHPIGFGCMSLPAHDENASIRMIHEALDQGVNFLDTADLYGQGQNEELLGKALRRKREQVVLATKVGHRFQAGVEGVAWGPTKAYIKQAIHDSLRRLGTDYIDLYQLHGGTMEDPIDEIIEAFEELQNEGLIRAYGISSIRPAVIATYLKKSRIVSVMMQFSLLDRRPEEWFPMLQEHGVSVIARGPLAKGVLSDHSRSNPQKLSSEQRAWLMRVSEQFPSQTLESIALQYVWKHPVVATSIPGASKMEQLQKNLFASQSEPLTDAQYKWLQASIDAAKYQDHRIG